MARKRTPQPVAEVTGQAAARPGRYAKRLAPHSDPLGPPPEWFRADQIEAWQELSESWPWLRKSDRCLVMIGAILLARITGKGADAGVASMNQFRMICSACGGTPTDRSRVSAPDHDGDDPANEFIN